MGIWFLVSVLTFFTTGVWALYSHFQKMGLPASAGELANTAVLFSIFLVVTAVGLLVRQRWARAGALAVSGILILGASEYLAGIFFSFPRRLLNGFGFLQPLLPKLPENLSVMIGPGEVMSAAALVFAYKTIKLYSSSDTDVAFESPRPAGILVVILTAGLAAISFLNQLVPANFHQELTLKSAATQSQVQPAPDGTQGGQRAAAEAAAVSASERGVRVCQIALDESKILLVSSDEQVHTINLRTGKTTHHQTTLDPGRVILGPDANTYFDPDLSVILRLDDAAFRYPVSVGSSRFVSFTSSPRQILVFQREQRLLRKIEMPLGNELWSYLLEGDDVGMEGAVIASPDHSWIYVPTARKRMLFVNLRDGRVYPVDRLMESVAEVQFGLGPGIKWAMISGEMDGGGAIHILVNLTNGSYYAINLSGGARWFDNDRQIYLDLAVPSRLRSVDGKSALPGFAASALYVAQLNPPEYLVTVGEQQAQVAVLNLDSKVQGYIGQARQFGFNQRQTCFALSASRRIFAVAFDAKVEIFWSGHLLPRARTLVVDLPLR